MEGVAFYSGGIMSKGTGGTHKLPGLSEQEMVDADIAIMREERRELRSRSMYLLAVVLMVLWAIGTFFEYPEVMPEWIR